MQTRVTRLAAPLIMMLASVGARADDSLLGMTVDVDIPPQQLETALIALSRQAGVQLQMPAEIVAGLNTSGVHGPMTLNDAFVTLLEGTALTFRSAGTKTIGIQSAHATRDQASGTGAGSAADPRMAIAQTTGVTSGTAHSSGGEQHTQLEEIIVSATRREQSIQTAPVSINAYSGEQLTKAGYVGVGQFLDAVPGVTSLAEGPGNNVVIIRNVATSTQEPGSAVTATYFDDFAIVSPLGGVPEIRLVDMERVEVLKGPQGTLFGRSAMGGIVRFISNKPDATAFAGGVNTYVSQTTDGGTNIGGHGYLNVPLGENLAARLVAYRYQNDGFIDNVELGVRNFNEEDTVGARAAVRWQPTDALTLDLTYVYQDTDAAPNWASDLHTPSGDIPFDVERRDSVGGVRMKRGFETQFVNLRVEQQFAPFTATLLATHTRAESGQMFDQREYVNITTGCACDYLEDPTDPQGVGETDILELRVVSPKERFIDYIFGFYYEDSQSEGRSLIRYFGPPQEVFGGLLTFTDGLRLVDRVSRGDAREQAVYGEAGFNFTEQTRLALGYRWSDVRDTYQDLQASGIFDFFTGAADIVGIEYATREKVGSYKIALEHRLEDGLFIYALASSGYRRGGFNSPTLISPFSTYGSDSLWNYEIGVKSTWLDGRLVTNVATYYLDFSDIQLVVQDPLTFERATRNAGKARIPGIELSLAWQATDDLALSASGAWSDPQLLEDVPGGVSGKKGDRLPGSATQSFSVSANFDRPLAHGFNLVALATYKYIGERLNDFNTTLDVALASYDMLDLRLGVRSDRGYSVALFADNVFDEATIYRIDHQGATFDVAPTSRPRTVGVNFSYDF
jgi:iron complex outermembrane recepter protein